MSFPKPDLSVDVVPFTVPASPASTKVLTIPYPRGRTAASYGNSGHHKITGRDFTELTTRNRMLSIDFTATNVVVTNNSEVSFKAGSVVTLTLDRAGYDPSGAGNDSSQAVADLFNVEIDLGAPIATSANGIALTQAVLAATAAGALINGAFALNGVATLDVPRNVVAAWTGAAVLTVTGTDEFGAAVTESSASGTSFAGKKAFKTVTRVTVGANVTALTVGTGKVIGIPVFVGAGQVTAQVDNGVVVTDGVLVLGDTANPTALTGDVRGTYAPNAAPNGTKRTGLVASVRSKSYRGRTQFAS